MHSIFARFSTLGLAACALSSALAGPIPTGKPAHYPDWWFERDVIPRLPQYSTLTPTTTPPLKWPDHYPPADDYAAANVGQLKNLAYKAAAEFDTQIEGGRGAAVNALIAAWEGQPTMPRDDYAALNIGQLKSVAKILYDRLAEAQFIATPLYSGSRYPWASVIGASDDYALVNMGQLKQIFSFDLSNLPSGTKPLLVKQARLWLTSERGVIADSTDNVLKWLDQSGNGFVALPPTPTARPKLIKDSHFERSAVRFDGIDDSLNISGLTSAMPEFSIIWLMKISSTSSANQQITSGISGGFTFGSTSTGAVSVGTNQATQIIPGSGAGKSPDGVLSVDKWIICGFTYFEGIGTFYKNGLPVITKTGIAAPSTWGALHLGASNANTLHGELAELLVYAKALPPQEMLTVNQSIYTRYNFSNDADFDGRHDDEIDETSTPVSVTIITPAHNPSLN